VFPKRFNCDLNNIELKVDNNDVYRRDRSQLMTSRGGCAIFVKQQLKLIVSHLLYSPDLEVIAISCDQKNASTFYLSCVYRPPNSLTDFNRKFYEFLAKFHGSEHIL
jgi:hypothetical protein